MLKCCLFVSKEAVQWLWSKDHASIRLPNSNIEKKIFSLSLFDAMDILKQTRQKEETKITTMHS